MKIKKAFKRNPLAQWIACALAVASVSGAAYAAAPLAGTEIKNLATVSYEDENGNKYTAQSNEAVITVAPQYKATIENDRTQNAAPGQTVYFPHTIVNTGNVADTYTLAVDDGDAKIYLDTNGNGQPDSGESEIAQATAAALSLAAGETANVIVSYPVPVSADDNTPNIELNLSVTSDNGAADAVDDLAVNNGLDGNEGTSTDVIDVTTGPVLVLNKESVIDTVAKTITYTLTVKNTGGSDAADVDILDPLPMVDTNGDGTKDTQVTLVPNSIVTNGLLDADDTVAAATNEAALGWDVNVDGTTGAGTAVIKATDDVLSPNTTISVSYSVSYMDTWAAGADIDNTFTAFEDINDTDQPVDTNNPPPSNTTHNEVPQNYGADANDDGLGIASVGVNNGNDDDATADSDVQFVDTIASGDVVVFTHTITNNGNGDDIFNLEVANGSFPAGTVFTLWNADGTVQLTDSDSDGKPDTGVLGQNAGLKVVVKADLPAGASSPAGTNHTATLAATSSGDDTVSDTTVLTLGEITAPAVDLAANGATQANTGLNDAGVADAHDEGPIMLKSADVGGTVTFPMTVANESGSADAFLLGTTGLPTGWSVVFKDASGNTITSTPFLPAGTTFDYSAVVTVSSDATEALGNSDRGTDTDGNDTTDNATNDLTNTDGDNDYVIQFDVTSSVDGNRTDSITNAVDVNDIKAISVTPDGQNQVQPGGTVEYPHTLKNDGNVDEAVELTSAGSDPDWSSSTLIDTTGDGVGDTELTTLTAGTVIKVYNPDGTTSDVTLTDSDNDNNVEFPLEPGQYVKLTNKVFAPADSPQGEVNTTTISATDPGGTVRNTAEDNSTVILGQVRLTKTVAVDTNCDKNPDSAFAEIQATKVEPGQCVVWEIFAKNEGDAKVKNVVVTDIIPTYTTLIDDSLMIDGVGKTRAIGDDDAEVSNTGVITYYLGTGTDFANGVGGELLSGASSTVRFTVEVDE